MRVNVLLVRCPFTSKSCSRDGEKKRVWMCSSRLGSLSRSSGVGQEDCFLFIYSLSYNQSSFTLLHPDFGDIPDASAPCKNTREQLKAASSDVSQKMSSTVTDLRRFHYLHGTRFMYLSPYNTRLYNKMVVPLYYSQNENYMNGLLNKCGGVWKMS